MTIETDVQVEGGAEAEVSDTQVENNSEATTEQNTGTEESGQADDAGEAAGEPTKRTPWFQKRIDEVTRQKYEAQREADYWRGRAEGNVQPQQPQQQVAPPDRWEEPEKYDQYLIDQAVQRAREDFSRQQVVRTYEERMAAVRAVKPDFDQVATDPTLPVSPTMAHVIWESEKGPEILYHLGSNRSESARIASLPPHLQAAALGKIEASLTTAPPQAQTPKTPPAPPPKTVSGITTGINKAPEEMTMAEYVAWRNKQAA